MARRYIQMEIEGEVLHVAVACAGEQAPRLEEVRSLPVDKPNGLKEALEQLQGELQPGLIDTVELALPSSSGFARVLDYPFTNQRKLTGVVPPDFWYRLPVEGDNFVLDYFQHVTADKGSRVEVAAIGREQLTALTQVFAEAQMPLSRVSLLPWGLVVTDGKEKVRRFIAWVRQDEVGVALCEGGEVSRLRVLAKPSIEVSDVAEWLLRQADILERLDGWDGLPILLYGESDALAPLLGKGSRKVLFPERFAGVLYGDAQNRVVQLACSGATTRKPLRHNFMHGEFSPSGGWQGLLRPLRTTFVMAGVVTMLFVVHLWMGYHRLAVETDRLEQRSEALLRKTFPEIRTLIDRDRQLQSQLGQLRQQAGTAGTVHVRPLSLLRRMSEKLPDGVDLVVNEWILASEEIRLEGTVASFESVERLSAALEGVRGIEQAVVTESKTGRDNRIVFRLRLVLGDEA